MSEPILSAVVISANDEATIERTVASVVGQELDEPFEVIVVNSGHDRTAEIVERRFPDVRVVRLHGPALPGRARNAGLRLARGMYVSFPGSHVELPPGSLAARLRAHRLGFAMVSGTLRNGTLTPAGWASYFLDNRSALPGRPSGALSGAPVRCSYLREALLQVDGFREDLPAAEDTLVNANLHALGYRAYRSADVTLTHHSPCRTPRFLVRHHFRRGRGMARVLAGRSRLPYRAAYVVFLVPARLIVITRDVLRHGRGLRRTYLRSFPLVLLGAASHWAGVVYELSRPAKTPAESLPLAGLGSGTDARSASSLSDTTIAATSRCPSGGG
jgi:glycosyltransferase involved in cell wall biosynthesis